MARSKVFRRYVRGALSLAALALCVCDKVPEYCGDGNSSFDFRNQRCVDGTAYSRCGGDWYNPKTHNCHDGQVVSKQPGDGTSATYTLTVTSAGAGATGSGSYAAGMTVTINAGTAPEGQQFKNWTETSGSGVIFADANSAKTTFIMPGNAVAVTANFETSVVEPAKYTVTVTSAGTNATENGSYTADMTVNISAGTAPDGQVFKNWTTESDGVTFANANSPSTSFTMPANDVAVTANFETAYTVTVSSAGTGSTLGGSYVSGAIVTITAGTPPNGQRFKYWTTTSVGVTLADANSATTTFTMPGNAVAVSAVFEIIVENGTFTDNRSDKTYKTVKIGNQTWMAENLNYDVADGSGSWCYKNSPDSCAKYGRLYDWSTAMGLESLYNNMAWNGSDVNNRGVCPLGWHLPSRREWGNLAIAVGGLGDYGTGGAAGTKLKAASGWNDSGDGTDELGFSGLPGGRLYSEGNFDNVGNYGYWWTATQDVGYQAYLRDMSFHSSSVSEYNFDRSIGYSVRCVQDE